MVNEAASPSQKAAAPAAATHEAASSSPQVGTATVTVSNAPADLGLTEAEAQARFRDGVKLADQGKYEEARVKFLQAATVIKTASVMYNLARAEQSTGHDAEAIEHYRTFIKSSKIDPRFNDSMREKAKEYIADLLTKVGQVEIDAPDGARISVNGKVLDEMPSEPIPVARNSKNVIEASYRGMVKSITVSPKMGEVAKASFNFDAPATPQVQQPAPLTSPPPRDEEKASRSTAGWVVPGVLGGVGVVGIGLGVGFAVASHSAKNHENSLRQEGMCPNGNTSTSACQTLHDAGNVVNTRGTISTVGYVAGGALILGAVASWLLWPTDKEKGSKALSVVPEVGPGTASFQFRGNF